MVNVVDSSCKTSPSLSAVIDWKPHKHAEIYQVTVSVKIHIVVVVVGGLLIQRRPKFGLQVDKTNLRPLHLKLANLF
jgi:hypothetical protein